MKRSYRQQRLARHEEKAVISRIFWLSAISVILIIFIFTYGIKFLGRFADFLDTIFKKGSEVTQEDTQVPPQPIINQLPEETNEGTLTISGFSPNSSKVELYLDGNKVDEVEVAQGSFEFKDVVLTRGSNEISAKAVSSSGGLSDFSQSQTVIFDKQEPDLEVTSPVEGQNFHTNNKIKVTGKTEVDAQVFANGFLANVNSDGNFEVTIPLTDGENTIKVEAKDTAGNSKTSEIKVQFNK